MIPINALWNILLNTVQTGVDVNNDPIYIDKSRLVIENQDNFIIPSANLLILLSHRTPSEQVAKGQTFFVDNAGNMNQQIIISYRTIISIDLLSKDYSAVTQKDLLEIYLNSYTSTDLQAKYGIFIAEMTPTAPTSLSELEGADRINRFRFDVSINHSSTITYQIPYYDNNFIPQSTFN